MAWKDFETRLKAKYRKQTRTITTAVEDCYLRDDIPCGSALCTSCAPTTSHLAASASFLMIPDSATLSTYLEILELPEISNYIILSSELRKFAVKSNMRKSARMRALYRDKRRHCFLFNDMNCMQIHDMTREGVPSILSAAEFYANHLDQSVSVVVVSDKLAASNATSDSNMPAGPLEDLNDLLALLNVGTPLAHQQQGQDPPSDLPPGVRVVSTQECFTSLWGHCQAVADLFDSLNQAKKQEGDGVGPPATGGEVSYKQYCTQQVLEEGLAAGEFLRGSFQVSKRNPFEAVVQVGSSSDSQLGRLIQVSGRAAMNRAMHGDTVAVRLLPMSFTVVSKTDEEPHVDGAPSKQNVDDLDFAAELMDTVVGENDMELEARGQLAHGEVVGILLQQSIDIVACVSSQDEEALTKREEGDNRQEALICVPLDRRLPFIRVRTRQAVRLRGMRFVLRIDNWERSSRYPNGHISKILGPIHELKAESEAVLVQCGINWQPFCQGAMAELPIVPEPSKWRAAPEELAVRRDLRGPEYFVVSIDPVGCTDIDDAMHVRFIEEGSQEVADLARLSILRRGRMPARLIEVGVHIADVSYFVRPGGLLDGEARDRCTSVYLVDRRLDMLPSLLSEHLCSLRSKSERYSMSVIWVLDADTLEPVVKPWFGRTVISSRHELHYQQAQDVLDGLPPAPGDGLPAVDRPVLLKSLQLLKVLTDKRHARRVEDGALELTSAEIKFKVDESGQPCSGTAKKHIPMMDVVAEMMIMANAGVAQRIAETFPGCALLRNHPPPRQEAFDQVRSILETGGDQQVDPSSNRSLSQALAAVCERAQDPALAQLIKSMITRAMSEAKYFSTGAAPPGSSGSYHYGLALPYYTHFTSPIRRYADVIVHRQLMAALAASESGVGLPPMQHAELALAASAMNERHREAKAASKECSEMYLLLLLHNHPHAERALVVSVQDNSVEVYVQKYHLKGRVRMVDSKGKVGMPLLDDVEDDKDPFSSSTEVADLRYSTHNTTAQIHRLDCASAGSEEGGSLVWQVREHEKVWVRLGAAGSRFHSPKLQIKFLADTHPLVLEARATTSQPSPSSMSSGGRGVPAATPLIGGHGRPPSQAAAAPSAGAHPGGGGSAYPTKSTHAAANESSAPLVDFAAASGDAGRTSLGDGRILTDPMGFLSPSHYKGAASLGGMTNEGGIDPLCRIADGDSYVGLTTSSSLEGVGHLSGSNADEAVALVRLLQARAAEYESKIAAASLKSSKKERWVRKLVELEALMQTLHSSNLLS